MQGLEFRVHRVFSVVKYSVKLWVQVYEVLDAL